VRVPKSLEDQRLARSAPSGVASDGADRADADGQGRAHAPTRGANGRRAELLHLPTISLTRQPAS